MSEDWATLAAPVDTNGTGQTEILALLVANDSVAPGTTFLIKAFGSQNGTAGTPTFQVNLGTTGTPADTAITASTAAAALTSASAMFDALVTLQGVGPSGSVVAGSTTLQTGGSNASATPSATPVDTTKRNYLSISVATTAGTFTVSNAVIEGFNA